MNKILGVLVLFFISSGLYAQFSNFNTQKNWSMNKKEFVFGGGSTQFLGDLGGQSGIGKDYSLADIDWKSTSYNFTIAFRYRFHPNFATTSSLNFGAYKASDFLTDNFFRNKRQINIKSTLLSFSQRFEYIVFANEKVGKRNNIPGLKGMKDKNTQVYVFSGAGLAYYEPRSGANGSNFKLYKEGIKLRPLSTEGQGKPGGFGDSYKSVTAIIPFGIGYRVGISRMWRVAIEATYFKTFTDYMDDVSTEYYSYTINNTTASTDQIFFSNPSEDWTSFTNGDKRGDKQKDAFFYVNLTFAKNVTYKSYDRGKAIKWRGVRAKF